MQQKLKLAIAGIGNNASALMQGVTYYESLHQQGVKPEEWPGIRQSVLGGFSVFDIEFVAGFDIDERKIGRPLSEAIFCGENNYPVIVANLPVGPSIMRGIAAEDDVAAVAEALKRSGAEVLLYGLPTGLQQQAEWYAEAALAANVAFVNCTPEKIARTPEILARFTKQGTALLGDDLASHFGSSVIHKGLLKLISDRGLTLQSSFQVNLGGNSDFKNLAINPSSKRESKMNALGGVDAGKVEVIPSGGFLSQLEDTKIAYFNITAAGWAGTEVVFDAKLKVQDSSNAAGVIIDLVRVAASQQRMGLGGMSQEVASLLKSPGM
ncbi:myo-inositol-1-phosphate synthase [Paludibacterium purpuratum]|uniref:Myo-inositol-1-phosphate synthase n=1 Tax=Paludibacterium purpuratum TaxID=1144873 RepID=A0A4R7B5W4_9NEIS|nr:myo-inositol-1-phosphate synthase [Paludibacterium purpuratum]TDR80074.1 myo-inositol-1-phosphate synthase [Paludibacterium purpuratum]